MVVENSQNTKCCEVLLVFGEVSALNWQCTSVCHAPRHDAADSANTSCCTCLAFSQYMCKQMWQKRLLANKGTN